MKKGIRHGKKRWVGRCETRPKDREGREIRAVPYTYGASRGFRFPKDPATPAQIKRLRGIAIEYLRRRFLTANDWVTTELAGEIFGLSERQSKTVVKRLRDSYGDGSCEGRLVIDVLGAMAREEIAGVLGTPRTKDHHEIFKIVYEFDAHQMDELPASAEDPQLVLEPIEPERITAASGAWAIATQNVQGAQDMAAWQMFHAAFRLDFQHWSKDDEY